MIKFLKSLLLAATLAISTTSFATSIVNPESNGGGCCSGYLRGYFFTAPTNFTLDTVWLNQGSGLSTNYRLDILRFDSTPPNFSSSTTNYTVLQSIDHASGVVDVNINFSANDIVGFLAYDYNLNTTPYSNSTNQTLDGIQITLFRLLMQGQTLGGAVSAESSSSNIGAVGFTTVSSVSSVPVPAAAWLFGTGLVGLAGLRRKVAA